MSKQPITVRPGRPEDATECGRICYAAFQAIAGAHGFPPDFPVPEAATGLMHRILSLPHVDSWVAELEGKIAGSNFLHRCGAVAGVGPITVDPVVQNGGVGRRLMERALAADRTQDLVSVRLVQAAYHNRSLSLYTRLGFNVDEPLSTMQGPPLRAALAGFEVRPATKADLASCADVCRRVHGFERTAELAAAIDMGSAALVEHDGRVTAYATMLGYFGHAVADTNDGLKALIAAAPAFPGPGFLLPSRNGDLFRWCLAHGLRVVQPCTLMSQGLYRPPTGAFLPSILY